MTISKEELSEQLLITQKMTSAIEMMAKSMSKIESSYDTQIAAVEKLTTAIGKLKGENLEELDKTKFTNLQSEFDKTEKNVTSFSEKLREVGINVGTKFVKHTSIGVAALSGFGRGIINILALGRSTASFFASFVDGALSIGAAIISIPFKMFNGLVDMAAAAGGGSNELALAIEHLRDEMGNLKESGSKAVLDTAKTFKNFGETGLSVWRVFGSVAERLETVIKVATSMGATFGVLKNEFVENGGALLAYQKGLGVTDEQMKGLGDTALMMGKPMSRIFLDMTKQTLALGKAFDIDQKLIGKDMTKALIDVGHFGGATVKQIGVASVYARKLGLELDKIVGTLDSFETFDSAAENAAKLSQAFGVSIDAFKMMEAQSPADQLDMLRTSFRNAGVDASTFSRQQLKLLSTSTGLSAETVKQAFSAKNYGTSLDSVNKKADAAEKKTMSQAEAMNQLADSIKRLTPSGGSQLGGFWETFVHGFMGGVQATKEFRDIIWNIKRSLRETELQGVRLGRAFVAAFPGMKEFLGGIGDFFKPAKFKSLASGVVDVFINFMEKLKSGPASFGDLMKSLQDQFFKFFDASSPASQKMMEGFKTVLRTISSIVSQGIVWVSTKIADGVDFISDVLSGNVDLGKLSNSGSEGLGFIWNILEPMIKSLGKAWDLLYPALKHLFSIALTKLWTFLKSDTVTGPLKEYAPHIAAILFGPALLRALMTSGGWALGEAAKGLFSKGSSIMKGVADKAEKMNEAGSTLKKASKGSDAAEGISNAAKSSKAATELDKSSKWGVQEAVKLGLKLVAMAGALSLGGIMMAYAVVKMYDVLKSGGIVSYKDAAAPLLVLGAMVTAAVPLMFALKIAANAGSPSEVAKGGALIASGLLIVGGVGSMLTYVLNQVGSPAELSAAGKMMGMMTLVFLGMVPLVLGAMAVGAVVSASGGTALAAAAVGMATMGTAVGAVATLATVIIAELRGMTIEAGFQTKIDAFLSIMKTIQTFSDTLVSLVSLMTPSIAELVSGKTKTFTEKVNATIDMMKEMIGVSNTGTGIIGIVETVVTQIKSLSSYAGIGESAKIFADVLTAVSSIMQYMTPNPEFMKAQTSLLGIASKHLFGDDVAKSTTDYVKLMTTTVKPIMNSVIESMKELLSISVPDVTKAQALGNLLNTVSGIMKGIMPDPASLKAFSTTAKAGIGPIGTEIGSLDASGLATFIGSYAEKLGTLIPTLTSGILNGLANSVGSFDKSKIESLTKTADILTSTANFIKSISDISKMDFSTSNESETVIQRMVTSIDKIISEESMKGIFETSGRISKYGVALGAIGKTITNNGIVQALAAVGDMVRQTQMLDDALNAGTEINVDAKLQKLAQVTGIGGKFAYTVQSKEVVINLNMQIFMDVAETEKVLIMNKKSIIRDRLNFATNTPNEKGQNVIPEEYQKILPNVKSDGAQ
jgi:hypothetical protein